MPVCCRCNGSGRCVSCSCIKAGRSCTDCLPSRNGRCSNAPSPTPVSAPTSTPVSAPTSDDERLQLADSTPAAAPTADSEHRLLDGAISTASNGFLNDRDMVGNDNWQLSSTVAVGPTQGQTRRPPSLPPFRPAPSMTSSWGGVAIRSRFLKNDR